MSNSIEVLKKYNISDKDIEKLKLIGITTIQSLYMTSRKNLLKIKGFTEKKILNIFNEANKVEEYSLFQNGSDFMYQRNKNIKRISTGSKNLDNILKGGLEINSLNEIIGENYTNIIDFIHVLCINIHKNNNKIIYFNLDNNFSKEKILNISKGMYVNGKKVLENINLIDDVEIYDDLIDKLNEISESIEIKDYSLIIIDSLNLYNNINLLYINNYIKDKRKMTIFQKLFIESFSNKTEFNDIEKKIEIESKLGKIIYILKRISLLNNNAIIITRNINLDAQNDLIKCDPNIEIILNYECKTRLKFKQIKNNIIKCIILNSPTIPEFYCKFKINEEGILDC